MRVIFENSTFLFDFLLFIPPLRLIFFGRMETAELVEQELADEEAPFLLEMRDGQRQGHIPCHFIH